MNFQTRYGPAIAQVLNAYPQGPGLVAALETLIKTAEQNVASKNVDEMAQQVCEELGHIASEASGLKCLKCYHAEHHFQQEMVVQAEIDSKQESSKTDTDSQV